MKPFEPGATPSTATAERSPLLADLYLFSMLQAWFERGVDAEAGFELFVRELPPARNFLVAAGLEQVLDWLQHLRFEQGELDWLRATGRFGDEFLAALSQLRFAGDVWAMPEGTVFFPNEPVLRITAPIWQSQLVESRVLNLVHFQTVVASKAVRCVLAAQGRPLYDFGLRRSHGAEAALLSARSSYLAGFAGTATVLAGQRFGIPVSGTMAHSFVQAHADETDAFEHFARAQPHHASFLLDTWDTAAAARKVVRLGERLAAQGIPVRSVRIDSGDLAAGARQVRSILDAGGMQGTTILASGNLDEWKVSQLVEGGAPVDAFGIGTRMNTAADAPYLDCAYKLVSFAGRPTCKRSPGKATLPGLKQVWRSIGSAGLLEHDTIGLATQQLPGQPLLECVMAGGERVAPAPSLPSLRERMAVELARLPRRLRDLARSGEPMHAEVSPALQALALEVAAEVH